MKIEFSLQIFEKKPPSIKFHENPSSGGGVVPYGQTDGEREKKRERQTDRQRVKDRQTDMTREIVTFRNFSNAS